MMCILQYEAIYSQVGTTRVEFDCDFAFALFEHADYRQLQEAEYRSIEDATVHVGVVDATAGVGLTDATVSVIVYDTTADVGFSGATMGYVLLQTIPASMVTSATFAVGY